MVKRKTEESKLQNRIASARQAWRKRHSPSGLQFVLADRIDLIPARAWDSLTNNHSWFLSREYLSVIDSAGPENVSGRYAMAFDGCKPVAALVAQLVQIDGKHLISNDPVVAKTTALIEPGAKSIAEFTAVARKKVEQVVRGVTEKTKRKAVERIRGRVLVCGNLLSWGQHAVALSNDVSRPTAWGAVAEALYRIRRAERLSGQTDLVMLKDFPGGDASADWGIDELKDFDYRPAETDPNMVLTIDPAWKSFEHYLNSLSSKYRSSAKKVVKEVESAGVELTLVEDIRQHADSIFELYHAVQSRAAVRPVSISPDYLPGIAKAAGENFRCTIAVQEGRTIGFITTLRDGDTCVGYYIGFDYQVNQQCPLYFRLLQVCVEDAIRFGCSKLSLGRTALDPKARLGARPEATSVWLRHRQPILNHLLRSLLGSIPHDEAPDRNPFKS